MKDEIKIDGIIYVRKDAPEPGTRRFVVVDNGWIFAGNVRREGGYTYIDDAVWVFRWGGGIGMAKVLEDPNSEHLDWRPLPDGSRTVEVPDACVIFLIPVPDSWGRS